jgi:hypothetical protein
MAMAAISGLGRLRQDGEFEVGLGYSKTLSQKAKTKDKQKNTF